MKADIIEKVTEKYCKKSPPQFEVGDTVEVRTLIVEGNKERVQPFRGVVIARKGRGIHQTFTVRRIVNNEGVERVFPLHSPKVLDVKVLGRGRRRRAKLYYLRERVGKAVKLRARKPRRSESASSTAEADQDE